MLVGRDPHVHHSPYTVSRGSITVGDAPDGSLHIIPGVLTIVGAIVPSTAAVGPGIAKHGRHTTQETMRSKIRGPTADRQEIPRVLNGDRSTRRTRWIRGSGCAMHFQPTIVHRIV